MLSIISPLTLVLVLSLFAPCWSADNTTENATRLLVLGDSLAAGYGLTVESSFPTQLEKALLEAGFNVTVINAGVSGDTTAGGLARLEWALADAPHLVLLELGGNDALRGLPPEETFRNLDAILKRLASARIPVILAGMRAPRNLGESYATAFDRIYPQLASHYKVAFYPFFLEGVALITELNQADGIHPNASGVARIVSRMLPLVQASLDKLSR